MTKPQPKIDPLTLITPQGFDAAFWQVLPTVNTHHEAFEVVNGIYRENFGVDRYANHESYRAAKHRRYRNKE